MENYGKNYGKFGDAMFLIHNLAMMIVLDKLWLKQR